MKRIFSFLFAIIALVGTTSIFTACQEDAPEINFTINVTVNNDFTEVVNAINNGTMKQEAAIAALTAAIEKMQGGQNAKLDAIVEAINTLATTLDAKLAIIEAAMKAQTLALETKLGLIEAAIKALPDYSDQLKAIEAAIKGMPDYSDKLAAIETAIAALPNYSEQLGAIAAAIEALPDYTEQMGALETALEAIAANIEAQEGQYADELAALTEAIDAIQSEVAAGNKSQEDALAEIIALLESGAIAGGGNGSEGGEGESTYQSITITTRKAIGETITMTVQGELAASEVEGAVIKDSETHENGNTAYTFELTNQTVTIKQASIEYILCTSSQITSMDFNNSPDLQLLYCYMNAIKGENMTNLVKSLPDRTGKTAGRIIVYASNDSREENVITKEDVAKAKAKNWTVLDWFNNEYEGIELQYITLTTKKAVGEEFQFSIEIDGLGDLSADERMAILQAAVVDMNITDVAGHGDFYDVKGTLKKSNLKIEIAGSIGRFTCDKMGLTSLDVSHCPELYNIYCPGNDLTELDISKNTKLVRLVLGTNMLSSLDVSNATELQYLDCRYNSIETLDVSKNLNLERLDCYDNKLTSLDVSKNTKLDRVDCSINQLESLLICSSVAYGYEILTCYKNKLDEAAMTALIEALPTAQQSDARVLLYNNSDSNELNKLTDAHIAAAKDKGYTVRIKESDAGGWETK